MTDTINLVLPFIDGSQAQKHVTHNEALRILDAAVQIGVVNMNLTAPPPTPAEGERHVVAPGATGAWAGQGNTIAAREDGAWRFLVPRPGWLVWSAADNNLFAFDGTTWNAVGGGGSPTLDNVPRVGINSTATSPNLLTVRSNASLFKAIAAADSGSGDVRIQMSKESAANTASMFFSDAFSGRAEFGLTGDDDFHLKVSADGTTWRDAMKFDRATGLASFPSGANIGAFGFHNRVINPSGQIWQRANSGAAAITDVTYAFDRWYGLTQSAGVTASQVTNAENGTPFMMRLSQANATAQRFGIAQAIESANCIDLRGQDVVLSARVRMSVSATLRYAIIEWTGTADAVIKDVVNSWTNGTFTPGNFFNSANLTIAATGSIALAAGTLTSVALAAAVSGSMNNLLVFFWTDAAQAQNVTLDIGKIQLESGSVTSRLAFSSITEETLLCQRYFWINSGLPGSISSVGSSQTFIVTFPVVMRVAPALSINNASVNGGSVLEIGTAQRVLSSITVVTGVAANGGRFDTTSATSGTTFRPACLEAGAVSFNAEL